MQMSKITDTSFTTDNSTVTIANGGWYSWLYGLHSTASVNYATLAVKCNSGANKIIVGYAVQGATKNTQWVYLPSGMEIKIEMSAQLSGECYYCPCL